MTAALKRFGKSLEAGLRKLRPYFRPAYRRAFSQLVARGMDQRHSGEPIVCCDFTNSAIDAVGGRYYFGLVRDLMDAGYFPVFTARRATLSTFGTSALKKSLLERRFGVVAGMADLQEPFFLITDSGESAPSQALHTVRVSYETRLANSPDEIAFPFFVHPWIAENTPLPHIYQKNARRPARIFFGGNTEEGKYDKDLIRENYGILTRREMLAIIGTEMPGERTYRPKDAESWLASEDRREFVLCETQHCRIPPRRWMEALSRADFFLACPGVGMPLCHNLIEAMAAGAVPILQYGNYLSPPLEDGLNCLSFHDGDSLRAVIRRVANMSQEEILVFRENLAAYYDRHSAPGCFSKSLFSGPRENTTLLINAYRVRR